MISRILIKLISDKNSRTVIFKSLIFLVYNVIEHLKNVYKLFIISVVNVFVVKTQISSK